MNNGIVKTTRLGFLLLLCCTRTCLAQQDTNTYSLATAQLFSGAKANYLPALRHALANGADVNATDDGGATALIWASASGGTSAAEFLITNGADVNIRDKREGLAALLAATASDNDDLVELLIKKNADVNVTATNAVTPLMIAAQRGSVNIVKALLDHGAKFEVKKNDDGTTPLIAAADRGHADVGSALLLDRGSEYKRQTHRRCDETLIQASANGWKRCRKAFT